MGTTDGASHETLDGKEELSIEPGVKIAVTDTTVLYPWSSI